MRSLVLIAEDASTVRHIRLAARFAAALRVTATLDGRGSVQAELSIARPDIVLVDDMCQRMNTTARLREASVHAPDATVLLLVDGREPSSLDDAFLAGAHAVVSRRTQPSLLGALLGEIAQGHVALRSARSRADEAGAHVETLRAPRLLVVPDQDARGTRTSA